MPGRLAQQSPQAAARPERRRNLKLRKHFDAAHEMLEPLLGDNPLQASGTAFYRALRRLQEAFPDLTAVELEALVASVIRALSHRNSSSS